VVKIKICGITSKEDALKAVYYGAWAVGFVFHKKSPRYISPSRVKKIVEELPPFVSVVGVFVNLKEGAVRDICKFCHIHTMQFHGDETPAFCLRFKDAKVIKAFRVDNAFNLEQIKRYKVDAYLFDTYKENTYGGTGQSFNWNLLKSVKLEKPYILSGGLNSENIQQALQTLSPYAVDVSSGIENFPGVKNYTLMRTFCDLVNN